MNVRVAIALLASAIAACSSDPAPTSPAPADEAEGDGAVAVAVEAGTSGDTSLSSCLAACQNSSLSCRARDASSSMDAFLEPRPAGCAGELTSTKGVTSTLSVDCVKHSVCVDGACTDGTFTATTLGWRTAVCTRN